jgi:hypothetical protein
MADILVRIKRAVLSGRYILSEKATIELEHDGLTELDVVEAIANAPAIHKRIRSTSPHRPAASEYLYVIYGMTLSGAVIYTKGALRREAGQDTYYFFVSAKRAD